MYSNNILCILARVIGYYCTIHNTRVATRTQVVLLEYCTLVVLEYLEVLCILDSSS